MQQIRTNINGISTQSSYQDGTAYSLVNLRPKNGALHPVPPRKVIQELSQKYDIVFVHQNNDYKNWIGVVNSSGYSSLYWDVRDEQPQTIASYIQGSINSVQQIGNTLSLITEDNIYYLFYQNNKYTFLGELPNLPPIQLDTSNEAHIKTYFANEYGSGTIRRTDISFILRPVQFGSHYIKWLSESLMFTNLYDTDKLRWTVHSSNDGINFQFVSGVGPMDRKRYTKLDHGRIPGNKFSHFLFTFGATVGHESWIECIESTVGEEYKNRLTR